MAATGVCHALCTPHRMAGICLSRAEENSSLPVRAVKTITHTDTHTQTHTHRDTHTHTHRQTHTQTDRHTQTDTHTQTDDTDRQTTQTDRQTDTHRQTDRHTHTHTLIPWSVQRPKFCYTYILRPKKHLKNEQRSKDAAAKKRPNTSGVYREN